MSQTKLKLEGLHCQNCVKSVTEALKKIEGITSVNVTLDPQEALIEHNENVQISTIIAAVEAIGFDASI